MLTLTRELAWAAAMDAGNRAMRKAGRSKWSEEDFITACDEFDRLWPIERDLQSRMTPNSTVDSMPDN